MEMQNLILVSVTLLGFLSLSKHLFSVFNWAWVMFLRPPKNLKQHYGSWALITGSTDGIGKALAFELASKGLNLLLIGRDPSKLEVTSNHIRSTLEVQVKSKVIDLGKTRGEEIAKEIENAIEGLDIGLVINNAGVAYPFAKYFHEIDLELMESIIKVNVEAATWVTKAVLPLMLKKKKGAIVNVGSGSSVVIPSYPLYTIYAASKAYLAVFSKCTHSEYRRQGIDIQCQIPLFVATKMAKLKKTPFFVPSPAAYAKASVRWIGYGQLCTPIWSHSVQWYILGLLPNALVDWWIFNYMLGMRKRGLKKEHLLKEQGKAAHSSQLEYNGFSPRSTIE